MTPPAGPLTGDLPRYRNARAHVADYAELRKGPKEHPNLRPCSLGLKLSTIA